MANKWRRLAHVQGFEPVLGLGAGTSGERRLAYQALMASRLDTWGVFQIGEQEAAVYARAINPPNFGVTLDEVVAARVAEIEDLVAALKGGEQA